MSIRIAQLNGKCPCQRCQRGKTGQATLLAGLGPAGQRAGQRPSSLSLGAQVRLLLARTKRGAYGT